MVNDMIVQMERYNTNFVFILIAGLIGIVNGKAIADPDAAASQQTLFKRDPDFGYQNQGYKGEPTHGGGVGVATTSLKYNNGGGYNQGNGLSVKSTAVGSGSGSHGGGGKAATSLQFNNGGNNFPNGGLSIQSHAVGAGDGYNGGGKAATSVQFNGGNGNQGFNNGGFSVKSTATGGSSGPGGSNGMAMTSLDFNNGGGSNNDGLSVQTSAMGSAGSGNDDYNLSDTPATSPETQDLPTSLDVRANSNANANIIAQAPTSLIKPEIIDDQPQQMPPPDVQINANSDASVTLNQSPSPPTLMDNDQPQQMPPPNVLVNANSDANVTLNQSPPPPTLMDNDQPQQTPPPDVQINANSDASVTLNQPLSPPTLMDNDQPQQISPPNVLVNANSDASVALNRSPSPPTLMYMYNDQPHQIPPPDVQINANSDASVTLNQPPPPPTLMDNDQPQQMPPPDVEVNANSDASVALNQSPSPPTLMYMYNDQPHQIPPPDVQINANSDASVTLNQSPSPPTLMDNDQPQQLAPAPPTQEPLTIQTDSNSQAHANINSPPSQNSYLVPPQTQDDSTPDSDTKIPNDTGYQANAHSNSRANVNIDGSKSGNAQVDVNTTSDADASMKTNGTDNKGQIDVNTNAHANANAHGQGNPGGCSGGNGKCPAIIGTYCRYNVGAVQKQDPYSLPPENIDLEICDNIAVEFALLDADNLTLKPSSGDGDLDLYKKIGQLQKPTFLTLGGYTDSGESEKYLSLFKNEDATKNFIENTIQSLKGWGFHGLELCYIWPGAVQSDVSRGTEDEKIIYLEFVKKVHSAFSQAGLLLIVDIPWQKDVINKGFDLSVMQNSVDALVMLTYDFGGSWNGKTGLYENLKPTGCEDDNRSIDTSVQYVLQRGVQPCKLIITLGTVARTFLLNDENQKCLGAPVSKGGPAGPELYTEGILSYMEACIAMNSNWATPNVVSSYLDVKEAAEIALYARDTKLAGVCIAAVDGDDSNKLCLCGASFPITRTVHKIWNGATPFSVGKDCLDASKLNKLTPTCC